MPKIVEASPPSTGDNSRDGRQRRHKSTSLGLRSGPSFGFQLGDVAALDPHWEILNTSFEHIYLPQNTPGSQSVRECARQELGSPPAFRPSRDNSHGPDRHKRRCRRSRSPPKVSAPASVWYQDVALTLLPPPPPLSLDIRSHHDPGAVVLNRHPGDTLKKHFRRRGR